MEFHNNSKKAGAKLVVVVHPNASRSEMREVRDSVLHVRIAAPPIEGKANKALVEFLSDALGTAKSNVTIEKGLTGKRKTLLIQGMELEEVLRKLAAVPHRVRQP